MAERPVFIPKADGPVLVKTEKVSFQWFPGMAVSQKQKSIAALHSAAVDAGLCRKPLEVSSKSPVATGVTLSAFNLGSRTQKAQRAFTVETAFQSSKVFEQGGPYRDLLYASSREAKKDQRLRQSGRLLRFDFFGDQWALEPKTAFYDWLYINTLVKNEELVLGACVVRWIYGHRVQSGTVDQLPSLLLGVVQGVADARSRCEGSFGSRGFPFNRFICANQYSA